MNEEKLNLSLRERDEVITQLEQAVEEGEQKIKQTEVLSGQFAALKLRHENLIKASQEVAERLESMANQLNEDKNAPS
jgi:HD-GYP domain-containing protein (c-di-GMP phosphodiesterase class II)